MLVERDLVDTFGDPLRWEVLSYTGHDALVYSSQKRPDKVLKLYPYVSLADLSWYKYRTFVRSIHALLLGRVPIRNTDFVVENRVVQIGRIGEVHIDRQKYRCAISPRVYGHNLSAITNTIHDPDYDLVRARQEIWGNFFLTQGVLELMSEYLERLSTLMHMPKRQLTFTNTIPVGVNRSVGRLMITDTEAKILSQYRVVRNPLDLSKFGV